MREGQENNKVKQSINGKAAETKTGEVLTDKDFEFMKEKIKERPINRKKLIRKTIITASMAVVFGLIACVTFLLLEPVLSNWLYPEEEPKPVTFPEVVEEMLPEDMLQKDPQITVPEYVPSATPEPEIQPIVEKVELQITDYQLLYQKLYTIAQDSRKSMVTVTGVTSDVDWFNNTYESKGQTSGLIVADNGKKLLILVDKETVEEAESIQVIFCDGKQTTAAIEASDPNTNLSIISVPLTEVGESTRKEIVLAKLDYSNGEGLAGSPIVAVGSPMGTSGSVVYGMLTSTGNTVNVVDNSYQLMTTDIYGSLTAGGVILNMEGTVIGVIDMNYNGEDSPNVLSAIAISGLTKTITKLSNAQQMAYLGIYGTDVTEEANADLKVPFGAYVTEIVMDSPAMLTGIQSGDVIVKIGETEITDFSSYVDAILASAPGDVTTITVMRQAKEGYQEMSFDITMGTLK